METVKIVLDTKASKELGFYKGNNYQIERNRIGITVINERRECVHLENLFVSGATIVAEKL